MSEVGGYVVLGTSLAYFAMTILIALYARKKGEAKTLKDWALTESGFGAFILLMILYGNQYSGNTLVGYPGNAYRLGFTWLVSVTFMISIIVVYLLFVPRLHVLSKIRGYITPSDYLIDRYNSKAVAIAAASLLIYGLFNYLWENFTASGWLFEGSTFGLVPYYIGVLLIVGLSAIYIIIGGVRGQAWITVVQSLMMIVGLFIILISILSSYGFPIDKIQEIYPSATQVPSVSRISWWFSLLILVGFGAACYPHAIQMIYSAKDSEALRKSFTRMAWFPFITTFFVWLIGMVCIVARPGIPRDVAADQIFPLVASDFMALSPLHLVSISFFLITAALAGIMSTVDSVFLSLGSMISKDFYARISRKPPSDLKLMRVAQISVLFLLPLLFLIAQVPRAILFRLTEIKFEVIIQAAPAIILGLYIKRLHKIPVLIGMLAGGATAMAITWSVGAWAWAGGVHSGIWGLLVNVVICVVLSYIIKPKKEDAKKAEELLGIFS
ncbi:MAG: sodium:solute symporter family protein [Candidatus Freyarchaeota archaeon]|nr:sodium:solute symporter family protein [Candidatus Jordarchaeia archaeon]